METSLSDKILLALETAKNVLQAEEILADKPIIDQRLNTCSICPSLKSIANIKLCETCGCSIHLKTKLSGASCPEGKW